MAKRIVKWFVFLALGIVLLFASIAIFLNMPAGKRWLSHQVSQFASDYLKTTVHADINYRIPDWIVLENFLIEDQKGDTLAAGGKLHLDIDMWNLLNDKVTINNLILENSIIKVNRQKKDTTFNYEFIVNALSSGSAPADTTQPPLSIQLSNIIVRNIHLTFDDKKQSQFASLSVGKLTTGFNRLDIDNSIYDLKAIELDESKLISVLNFTDSAHNQPNAPPTDSTSIGLSFEGFSLKNFDWNVVVNNQLKSNGNLTNAFVDFESFDLAKTNFQLNRLDLDAPLLTYSNGQKKLSEGIDYNNLQIFDARIAAKDIVFTNDSAKVILDKLTFREQSGLILSSAKGDINYTPTELKINELIIETPYSKIDNNLVIKHPSLPKITESLADAAVDLEMKDSHIGQKDVLIFIPDLSKNQAFKKYSFDKIWLTTNIKGKLGNLTIKNLLAKDAQQNRIELNGNITGLPSTQKIGYDINLTELSTTQKFLNAFLPDTLLQQYGIPEFLKFNGNIKGNLDDITTHLMLTSSAGSGEVDGTFLSVTSPQLSYKGSLSLNDINLNYLLKDDKLKTISIKSTFDGSGTDLASLNGQFDGQLLHAFYDGYTYQNIVFSAKMANQLATFRLDSDDKNINGTIEGKINLKEKYPILQSTGELKQLDLYALHLSESPLSIRTVFNVDFKNSNPNSPTGDFVLKETTLNMGNGNQTLGNLVVNLNSTSEHKTAHIKGDFMDVNLDGKFDYTDISNVLLTEINTYFHLNSIAYTPISTPSHFTLKGKLFYHPIITQFSPQLTNFEPITFQSVFDNRSNKPVETQFLIPSITYDSIAIQNVAFQLNTENRKAFYTMTLGQLKNGDFQLRKASITGQIAKDVASFDFLVKDSLDKNIHGLSGNLTSLNKIIRISLVEKGFLLYYNQWKAEGGLEIYPDGLVADNIKLNFGEQLLYINSHTPQPNAPISITTYRINLNQLGTAFLKDSTLIDGFLNSDLEVRNIANSPTYTGNFVIQQLALTKIPIGELSLSAANKSKSSISLEGSLLGKENDIQLSGDYFLGKKEPMDITLDIKQLSAKTLEAFSFGELKQSSGYLKGNISITGESAKPKIVGVISTNDLELIVTQIGTKLISDNQRIELKGQHAELNNFVLSDSLGQELTLNGRVLFADLPNFSYRIDAVSANFMAVDAPQGANEYFFGKAIADASIRVQGVNERFSIEGDIQLKKGTDLSMLIPDDEAGTEMQQLIQFVDKDKPTVSLTKQTQKEKSSISYNASITIKADQNSVLTLVMDELTGDNIRVKGNANLQAGINTNDELFMYGDYIITEGTYDFTFELLKKTFNVRNGSSIRWIGDPLDAEVNIVAQDDERSLSLLDYVSSNSNYMRLDSSQKEIIAQNKLPILLLIKLKNTLSNMQPSFEIATYENAANFLGLSNDVLKKMNVSLITAEGKIISPEYSIENENNVNKQAFSLIVLQRFFPENLLSKSDAGQLARNAEQFARKNVSKLLSDQLDNFASGLIKGIDLDVGLASDATYKSTAVSLGINKGFLNNRITVSVGRNFELENSQMQSNEIFDNIEASYRITKDGRYRFKAYRKNKYQTVLEGFVVETGIGFVITIEYDELKKKNKK